MEHSQPGQLGAAPNSYNPYPEYGELVKFSDRYKMVPEFGYGFRKLDRVTSGFHAGEVVVIGARPGEGKTSLATQIAAQLSQSGHKTVYFSNEMPKESLWAKIVSSRCGIPAQKIMTGELLAHEKDLVESCMTRMAQFPLAIYDKQEGCDPVRALSILQKEQPKAFIVDHIQMVRAESSYEKKLETIEHFMYDMKSVASRLNCTAILLSQCNRNVEGRTYYLPFLSDLKGSGAIEEVSDVVMLLAWPHKTIVARDIFGENKMSAGGRESASKFTENDFFVELAKNRFGEPGYVKLQYYPQTCFFEEAKSPEEIAHEAKEAHAEKAQDNTDLFGS